jgi:hypothetical protein
MKRIIVLIVALGFLSACVGSEKGLIQACNTASVSLSTLADFRAQGKLSADSIAKVDSAVAVISPICDPNNPPPADAAATIAAVEGAALPLAQIIQGVK